jgi:hypothetical protein
MKLEINHLAPYLPYGLKCQAMGEMVDGTEYDKPIPKLLTIVGVEYDQVSVEGIRKTITENVHIEDCFPILRPLSALETNMEDGHEYIELLNAMYGDSVTDFNFIGNRLIEHTSKDKGVTFDRIEYTNRTMPYYIMEFLFQHHFDIFELIPQGLAIAYNDL